MTSPTPPDFFAESANKSEHDAESAYCSDHIVDANKMVSAGLPSEEEVARLLCRLDGLNPDLPRSWNDDELLWTEWREPAQQILDLIRPAFEAKERDGVGNSDGIGSPFNACCYRDECRAFLARAFSAEAKLAQAVEAPRVRHKKRGGIYEVLGEAQIQTSRPLEDYEVVVVYRSLNTPDIDDPKSPMKGEMWARYPRPHVGGRSRAHRQADSEAVDGR